jgi:hypothetical protein
LTQLKEQNQMNSFEATPRLNLIAGMAGKFLRVTLAVSALATLGVAPTFAASSRQSANSSGVFANDVDTGGVPISAKRAAAVHECSVAASKYNFSTWQATQIEFYDECMGNHGEVP